MNIFKVVTAATLLLTLTGCGFQPGNSYKVLIERSASPALVEATLSACGMWEGPVPVHFEPAIVDSCQGGDKVICIHSVSHDELLKIDPHALHAWGDTLQAKDAWGLHDGGDSWIVENSVPPSFLHVTVAHEMGHAMSLAHTQAGTLMCGSGDCAADHVTPTDIEQWEALRK